MRVEFVEVALDDDDDFQLVPVPVDINDPRLTKEVVRDDPEADAYAKFVIMRVALPRVALPAIRVQW